MDESENLKRWKEHITPKISADNIVQQALDWWNNLPVQNLQNMNDSWVGYGWKYYPEKSDYYQLTSKEVLHIWSQEHKVIMRKFKIKKLNDKL